MLPEPGSIASPVWGRLSHPGIVDWQASGGSSSFGDIHQRFDDFSSTRSVTALGARQTDARLRAGDERVFRYARIVQRVAGHFAPAEVRREVFRAVAVEAPVVGRAESEAAADLYPVTASIAPGIDSVAAPSMAASPGPKHQAVRLDLRRDAAVSLKSEGSTGPGAMDGTPSAPDALSVPDALSGAGVPPLADIAGAAPGIARQRLTAAVHAAMPNPSPAPSGAAGADARGNAPTGFIGSAEGIARQTSGASAGSPVLEPAAIGPDMATGPGMPMTWSVAADRAVAAPDLQLLAPWRLTVSRASSDSVSVPVPAPSSRAWRQQAMGVSNGGASGTGALSEGALNDRAVSRDALDGAKGGAEGGAAARWAVVDAPRLDPSPVMLAPSSAALAAPTNWGRGSFEHLVHREIHRASASMDRSPHEDSPGLAGASSSSLPPGSTALARSESPGVVSARIMEAAPAGAPALVAREPSSGVSGVSRDAADTAAAGMALGTPSPALSQGIWSRWRMPATDVDPAVRRAVGGSHPWVPLQTSRQALAMQHSPSLSHPLAATASVPPASAPSESTPAATSPAATSPAATSPAAISIAPTAAPHLTGASSAEGAAAASGASPAWSPAEPTGLSAVSRAEGAGEVTTPSSPIVPPPSALSEAPPIVVAPSLGPMATTWLGNESSWLAPRHLVDRRADEVPHLTGRPMDGGPSPAAVPGAAAIAGAVAGAVAATAPPVLAARAAVAREPAGAESLSDSAGDTAAHAVHLMRATSPSPSTMDWLDARTPGLVMRQPALAHGLMAVPQSTNGSSPPAAGGVPAGVPAVAREAHVSHVGQVAPWAGRLTLAAPVPNAVWRAVAGQGYAMRTTGAAAAPHATSDDSSLAALGWLQAPEPPASAGPAAPGASRPGSAGVQGNPAALDELVERAWREVLNRLTIEQERRGYGRWN